MTRNLRNHFRQAAGRPAARQRGSLIIFVVVALALIALLGAAYLQLARMDRIATAQLSTSNIDRVAAAIIVNIGDILRDDLMDSNGNFFNQTDDGGDATDADEYYDYPWTNPAVSHSVEAFDGTTMATQAKGGSYDDPWLASTSPDFDTNASVPRWPKISNPYGIFLRIPKASGGERFPEERVVDHSGRFNTDMTISGTIHNKITGDTQSMDNNDTTDWEVTGVDTDGDGVPDARWTWAPIRSIGGVAYVMAVRIIDNSSLINVNIATGLTSDGATWNTGADMPRGYFPTDIDLTRMLQRADSNWAGELATNADSLFNYRGVDTASPLTPFGTLNPGTTPYGSPVASSRLGHFLNVVRFATWPSIALPTAEEFELRYGNGLNNNAYQTTILETFMDNVMRAADTSTDWTGVAGGATASDMRNFFQGGTGDVDSRTFPDVRKFLTTRSNAAIYAPNPANMHQPDPVAVTHQYDLVYQHRSSGNYAYARIADLFQRIYAIFNIGGSDNERYLATASLPVTSTEQQTIATEYALAIQDYSDADHVPTFFDDGSVVYFGMEVMPFIREVYLQIAYEDKELRDNAGFWPTDTDYDPPGNGGFENDGFYDTWERKDSSRGMVVEIGNPFDKQIETSMLEDRIRIVVRDLDDDSEYAVYPFDSGAPNIPSRGKLQVYSNASGALDEGGYGTDLPVDLAFSGAAIAPLNAGNDTLSFPLDANKIDGTKFVVELQIDVDPAAGSETWVTYDRMHMDDVDIDLPQYVKHDNFDGTERHRHVQVAAARDGQNIRYVSNIGRSLVAAARLAPTDSTWPPSAGSQPAPDYRNDANGNRLDGLELDTKGAIAGDANLDSFQIPIANRTIMSVAELGWIQMFGFTDEPTGDFPQRLSGDGSAALVSIGTNPTSTTDPIRRTLNFRSDAVVPAATGTPHAAMVMDQFTTLSPRNDGVDNDDDDGDGVTTTSADNSDYEQVVSGRININTAPLPVLSLAAPLPESVDNMQALMESIIAYRDDETTRPTGFRQELGIANLGELMFVNPNTAPSSGNMQWVAETGAAETNWEYDQYPLREGTGTQQDVADGAEETLARYQFLSQAFTTRSDTFTAYCIVLGYPAGDFRSGVVESKSFYVIYDRSNITTKDDRVRMIGPFER